jgi:NAD-dependent dihydropyrimidine dehydrogenase PreA subunit
MMTFVISQACVDVLDKSCIDVCPVDCIHTDDADRMCYIQPDACIDCALCEPACPVEAIFAEAELPAASAAFLDINRAWFTDRAAARAQVEAFLGSPAPAG